MPMHLATLYGACLGILAGIVISLLFNLDIADSIYRTSILTVCGAWMGLLLSWLNSLLPAPHAGQESHEGAGQQGGTSSS